MSSRLRSLLLAEESPQRLKPPVREGRWWQTEALRHHGEVNEIMSFERPSKCFVAYKNGTSGAKAQVICGFDRHG